MTTNEKPWDTVNPLLHPIATVEVRGAKNSTIRWTDKTTKREESMEKYMVAGEFSDGTQITLSQLGRDFTGAYPFERGKMYVFALKSYEVERDSVSAEFSMVAPAEAVASVKPVETPLPVRPVAAKAA